jgi:hypothetical protein
MVLAIAVLVFIIIFAFFFHSYISTCISTMPNRYNQPKEGQFLKKIEGGVGGSFHSQIYIKKITLQIPMRYFGIM